MTVSLAPRAAVLRSHDELRLLAAAGNIELGNGTEHEASATQVVAWVAANFSVDAAAIACSMADAVLPHVVAPALPGVSVLFFDPDYDFPETYAPRTEVAHTLEVGLVDVLPEQTVAQQDAAFGAEFFSPKPQHFFALRNIAPLKDALTGYEPRFTGVRT